MKTSVRVLCVSVLLASVLVTGCASRRGPYNPPPTSEHVTSTDKSEREAQLRDLVQRRRIQEAHSRDENQENVKRKEPYFFKEYAAYPDDTEPKIELQESDSRSAPLLASVVVAKIRYATRLHRSRDEALRDSDFLRDTGYERQEYALRNGRWISLGDTFIAEKSERQIDGVWTPVVEEETPAAATPEEQSGGWFKRTWGRLSGG